MSFRHILAQVSVAVKAEGPSGSVCTVRELHLLTHDGGEYDCLSGQWSTRSAGTHAVVFVSGESPVTLQCGASSAVAVGETHNICPGDARISVKWDIDAKGEVSGYEYITDAFDLLEGESTSLTVLLTNHEDDKLRFTAELKPWGERTSEIVYD